MADWKITPEGDLINFDNVAKISIIKKPPYSSDKLQTNTVIELLFINDERCLYENIPEWREILKELTAGGE